MISSSPWLQRCEDATAMTWRGAPLDVGKLARKAGMSVRRSTVIMQALGITPAKLLEKLRVEHGANAAGDHSLGTKPSLPARVSDRCRG